MPHPLAIDPRDPAPIWRQIERGVARLVTSGALPPGAPVPSVRELAAEIQVNPATVSKAYQRLVDAGLVEVRRGQGTFVASSPPLMSARERTRILAEAADGYAVVARTVAADDDLALTTVRRALTRHPQPKGEER